MRIPRHARDMFSFAVVFRFAIAVVTASHRSSESLPLTHEAQLRGSRVGMIYGTAWKKDSTSKHTLRALQAGFRSLDTANHPKHYNESLVGEAIARSDIERAKLWVQTKFTPDACVDTTIGPICIHI